MIRLPCRPLVIAAAALAVTTPRAAPIQALPQASDTTTVDVPESMLEPLVEDAVAADPTDVLELLEDLARNPLDVNAASSAELAVIPAITHRLAMAIVADRGEHGPFADAADLRRVEGMNEDILREALPYMTAFHDAHPSGRNARFPTIPGFRDVRRQGRIEVLQRVQRRIDLPRGYEPVPDSVRGTPAEPTRYLGSPERLYTRLRATYRRNLSLNLTLEKDPGEPFVWQPENGSYGYDFVSFHAAALRVGRLDALVLGDYVAEFGQGVALWRASGFGKGRDTVRPVVRRGRGIRPYGSTDENRFFRGAAATVAVTPWLYATGFASRRRYDARFAATDTSLASGTSVVGMPTSGLHRTPSELAQKRSLGQTLGGGGLEVRRPTMTLGIVAYAAAFDEPLARGNRPYQLFDFSGRRTAMMSAYGSAAIGRHYAFGEVARSHDGRTGGVAGVETEIGVLTAIILIRHYPPDFVSLHGYGFGERNGATRNETGVYLGMSLRPSPRWTVSGYFDQFASPWLRFGLPRPSAGHDALAFVEYRPRRWLSAYVQARIKRREIGARITSATGAELETLTEETRHSVRFQGEYVASRHVRMRSRIEASGYRRADLAPETGVMLFHDVRWAPTRTVSLDARLTYFDTETFNARLYQFENDLIGVMTNTLLSGRGTRAYAVLAVRPRGALAGVDARLKFAVTEYRDRHLIGSGLDQIEGRRVRDVGVQLRYSIGG